MTQIHKPKQIDRSIVGFFKDVYISILVLFYQISRWKGEMKSRAASMGVSGVLGILIVTMLAMVQMMARHHVIFNRWATLGGLAVLFLANDYVLIVRGAGADFEKRFQAFAKSKQVVLYIVAVFIVVGSVAAFFLWLSEYRHTPRAS